MHRWHETLLRVRYAETDQMGIAHHSNYLVWFEHGRSEFCRASGFSYGEMERTDGTLLVVAETHCRYKQPAFYEDLITVRTRVSEVRSRGIRFRYEIYREADGAVLAEGETVHIVTDRDKKVRTLPPKYRDLLDPLAA